MTVALCQVSAQGSSALPEYRPEHKESGILRSWGNQYMATLMKYWEEGFHKFQPDVYFSDNLKGSATGMLGLEELAADMAVMGRPIAPYDTYGVWRRAHLVPVEIAVATGSYNVPHKSFALTIFVHKDNPLLHLTVKQLDGIFGAQRTGGWQGMEWRPEAGRGEQENIRTWGQLGLKGDWANKPIHPYGPPGLYPGGMSFFQMKVLGGGDSWAEELREFADRDQMIKALGEDPLGIAYTGMSYRTPLVKSIALAEKQGGPYIEPSRANVANRSYPLTRSVYIYFAPDRPNGDRADPKVDPKMKEFLRYILSRQGQRDVIREGEYLPLTAEMVREQLKKLE
jgi:phosphate transport system substrate-binding protein